MELTRGVAREPGRTNTDAPSDLACPAILRPGGYLPTLRFL